MSAQDKWRYLVSTVLLWMIVASFMTESTCVYRATLGIPCPGCGMTRAFANLLAGHYKESFAMNPLWPLVLAAVVLMLYIRLTAKTLAFKQWLLTKRGSQLLVSLVILIFLVYIVRMVLLFPHTEPMTMNEKALWPQLYKIFIIHLP